jgi:hypothetical protein
MRNSHLAADTADDHIQETPLEIFGRLLNAIDPNYGHLNLLRILSSGKKLALVYKLDPETVLRVMVMHRAQAKGVAENEVTPAEIRGVWKGARPINLGWFCKFAKATPEEQAILLGETEPARGDGPLWRAIGNELRDAEIHHRADSDRAFHVALETLLADPASNKAAEHPYVVRKLRHESTGEILPAYGAIWPPDLGEGLLIPLSNAAYVWAEDYGYQRISPDGTKLFALGISKKWSFAVVEPETVLIDHIVAICEGWSTACTIAYLLGIRVVVALDCGQLPRVGYLVANGYMPFGLPERILVVADGVEAGNTDPLKKAQQAAQVVMESTVANADDAIPALVVSPKHPDGRDHGNFDFNDLWHLDPEEARRQLDEVIKELVGMSPAAVSVALTELDISAVVDEINKQFAFVRNIGAVVDLSSTGELEILKLKDFLTWYENKLHWVTDEKGKRKGHNKGKLWISHPRRREYVDIEFSPGRLGNRGNLNLWQGFAVKPKAGDCGLYKELLFEGICAGDEGHFNYLWKHQAHTVQKPWELPGVAIVLRGGQGIGKNTAVDCFGAMFGEGHFVSTSNSDHVIGRFNGTTLAGKLVVHLAEAIWGGDKRAEGRLKSLITDPKQRVETKGINAFNVDNYARLFISSNEAWCVPVGLDDRRFLILDVSDKFRGNYQFFDRLHKQMAEGGTAALLHELMEVDLADFNVRRLPDGASVWDLKIKSADSPVQWWFDVLVEGIIQGGSKDGGRAENGETTAVKTGAGLDEVELWPDTVPRNVLQENYHAWCKQRGIRHPASVGTLGQALKAMMPTLGTTQPRIDGGRKRLYKLPPLDVCRADFAAFIKTEVPWDRLE